VKDTLYRDAARPVDERVEDLLARMTPDEKMAQLTAISAFKLMGLDGLDPDRVAKHAPHGLGQLSLAGMMSDDPHTLVEMGNRIQRHLVEETRLGIPAIFHNEALAGLVHNAAADFPTAIALAATWDPALVERMNDITRRQTRALGIHQALSPVLDVARDMRWGRVQETYGEDPYLVSAMGVAFVRGLQGDDLREGVIATAKHFLGYAFADGGRNMAPVHLGDREIREVYARPIGAAVAEADLGSVMCAYSDVNGEPAASSRHLLTELLRGELGFEGFTVADYYAIDGLHRRQGTAVDAVDAGIQSLEAGLDVELPDRTSYADGLVDAMADGRLDPAVVDTSVRRVLRAKFALGLFDQPYTDASAFAATGGRDADRALARELATRSVVLLDNPDGVLPLPTDLKRIAVIGPGAQSIRNLFGGYSAPAGVEMFTGMMLSDDGSLQSLMDEDNPPDLTTLFGDWFQPTLDAPEGALAAVDMLWPEVPTILDAIRARVSDATEVGYALGSAPNDPSTDSIDEAVAAATGADVAVLVLGHKTGMAFDCTTGENRDRSTLELPGAQQALLDAVCATGTPVVVVMFGSRSIPVAATDDGPAAVVCAWLPGSAGGDGIADVLFGVANPSGRLPVTFPRAAGQCPIFHGHKQGGEVISYTDSPGEGELYPFGHGLSYTTFEYRSLDVPSTEPPTDGRVPVTIDVANTGDRAGEEVVQLYAKVWGRKVTRPVRELVGFARVALEPGEAKRVTFDLDLAILAYHDVGMRLVVTPGPVELMAGGSSADLPVAASLTLTGGTVEHQRRTVFLTDHAISS
jgi:beta-glucosidase